MTHFSDVLMTGAASTDVDPSARYFADRDGNALLGFPYTPMYVYEVTPAAALTNNLAAAQTVSGTTLTLQTSTGITSSTIGGTLYRLFDVARCVRFTGQAAGTTSTTATITGIDYWGQRITENVVTPVATASTTGAKAFLGIESISVSGNTTAGIAAGTSDKFGFPYVAERRGHVDVFWNNTPVTTSTGITLAVTSTPSATTGDPRGTYLTPDASDASKVLTVRQYGVTPNTGDGVYGKAQF